MQYSTLFALSTALMAAGVPAERVAVPYGMNPAQAAALVSAMNNPWAVRPPSAFSKAPMASSMAPQSMASMPSFTKSPKATAIPGAANSAMAFPSMGPMASMASPSFHSVPVMATPSPSSRFAQSSHRDGMGRWHAANQGHDSFRGPQGGTHGIEQSSGWHHADGLSQGSNGVGNTAGMSQDNSNGSQGDEGNTSNGTPSPGVPGQGFQPQQHGQGQNQNQNQNQNQLEQAPQPPQSAGPENPTPDSNQNQDQDQSSQAEHPTNEAPANDNQAPSNLPNRDADNIPSSPPHGGLAPVSPMQPGSNVAPMGFGHKKHGQDVGNAFCLGQCYASEEEANCGQPYSSPVYKEEHGCYTCCFTPQGF